MKLEEMQYPKMKVAPICRQIADEFDLDLAGDFAGDFISAVREGGIPVGRLK
jgi:hypothetical protein